MYQWKGPDKALRSPAFLQKHTEAFNSGLLGTPFCLLLSTEGVRGMMGFGGKGLWL